MKRRLLLKHGAFFLALSVFGGFAGGLIAFQVQQDRSPTVPEAAQRTENTVYVEESSIIDTVQNVSPAVVSIVITKDLPLYREQVFNFNDPFFGGPSSGFPFNFSVPDVDENGNVKRESRKVGGGSGFIVTADGLIVTNRHVVSDPEADYTVVLNNGQEYAVEDIQGDLINDIAILSIVDENGNKPTDLPTIPLGNSDEIQVGQRVIAIGNALAEYENTVTTGVISATGRSISAGSVQGSENLVNLIQTDASINPGNSGGPLVNLNGEVVGINTAIAAGAEGIGFAIPINDVKSVIEGVEEHGRIVRPYLGVRFIMLDKARAEELKLDVEGGALLAGDEANGEFAVIPGSPADKAGLEIKDVILEVDGEPVTVEKPLHLYIGEHQPGDRITLKIWRSGEIKTLTVTLGENE